MLEEEFMEPIHPIKAGKLKENKKKNRYLNILPCRKQKIKRKEKNVNFRKFVIFFFNR